MSLLFLVLFVLGCAQTEWTEIRPEHGWFLCEMPGKPKRVEGPEDFPPGFDATSYRVESDQTGYFVTFLALPEKMNARFLAPIMVRFLLEKMEMEDDFKKLEESDISLNQFEGQKITFRHRRKKGHGEIRFYTFLNYLIIFGAASKSGTEEFSRFFDSLKVLL